MDRITRIGITLMVGLAVIAGLVVAAVLALDMSIWVGLLLLAALDAALIGWAWAQLKRRRT